MLRTSGDGHVGGDACHGHCVAGYSEGQAGAKGRLSGNVACFNFLNDGSHDDMLYHT